MIEVVIIAAIALPTAATTAGLMVIARRIRRRSTDEGLIVDAGGRLRQR